MAQATGDRLALVGGQLQLRQPPATAHAEHVADRRAALQAAGSAPRGSRSSRACARARAGSRRANRRRIARVHSSGIHTASSSPAASSLANARASSRSVFARARLIPVSCGLTTTTRATCGSRIRAISPALPVTSNATTIGRSKTGREQLKRRRRRRDPASRADRPGLARSRPRRSRDAHPYLSP